MACCVLSWVLCCGFLVFFVLVCLLDVFCLVPVAHCVLCVGYCLLSTGCSLVSCVLAVLCVLVVYWFVGVFVVGGRVCFVWWLVVLPRLFLRSGFVFLGFVLGWLGVLVCFGGLRGMVFKGCRFSGILEPNMPQTLYPSIIEEPKKPTTQGQNP